MKQSKSLVSLVLLANVSLVMSQGCLPEDVRCDNCCVVEGDGYPFLAHRSQGVDSARELVGWQKFINRHDKDSVTGTFYTVVEYTKSFSHEKINKFLFGKDLVDCNTLLIQGSKVEKRNGKAWLADYFGLPQTFSSKVEFRPRIENAIVDLSIYTSLDEMAEGLYFRINAPIVWTQWRLNMCERLIDSADDGFDGGYMEFFEIDRDNLPCDFVNAVNGDTKWGDMTNSMKFGIMANCKMTETKLADIHVAFGWNFALDEDYHFGFNIRGSIPTGNVPDARYFFEPIVGNGGHWEAGVGLTGSTIFWRSQEKEDCYAGIWMDANLTHMFKANQWRSFDFCGKPNSRYMLLAKMGSNTDQDTLISGGDQDVALPAEYKYQRQLVPAINYTTFNVEVKVSLQADIALKLGYVRDNWSFDLGYNFWARTGEKFMFTSDCSCICSSEQVLSVKGDAYVYGYNDNQSYALSASQSEADIHSGKNFPSEEGLIHAQNPGIDNPLDAIAGPVPPGIVLQDFDTSGPVNTSIDPVVVSFNDINRRKSPSALTHKIFAHISVSRKENKEKKYVPFVGIGGFAEFSNDETKDRDCCDINIAGYGCNSCDPCETTHRWSRGGVSQWGVWVKGGIYFE